MDEREVVVFAVDDEEEREAQVLHDVEGLLVVVFPEERHLLFGRPRYDGESILDFLPKSVGPFLKLEAEGMVLTRFAAEEADDLGLGVGKLIFWVEHPS